MQSFTQRGGAWYIMEREMVNAYLRAYNEKENLMSAGKTKEWKNDRVYSKFQESESAEGAIQKTYIFEDDYFLSSYESIGLNRQDRFSTVEPHLHNYIELSYVWLGTCRQVINGKEVILAEGDVCILDTKAIHALEAAGEADIIINVLMRKEFFNYAFLNRMTQQGILAEFLMNAVTKSQNSKHYLVFRSSGNKKIRDIISDLICEYDTEEIGKREVLESHMVILFTQLLRIYHAHSAEQEELGGESSKLLQVLEYLEKHYDNCNLNSAAKTFGFNPQYLTMFLKEKTGRSFVEHLQEQKLNKAKILLAGTNISVSEIITQCGYSNENFFYQKFKKSTGYTPGKYREFIQEKRKLLN